MKKAVFIILIGVVLFLAISVVVLLRGVQQVTQPVIELQQGVSTEVARLLHPTPTIIPDPVTIIHEIQSLARLETIHYSVEKVITAETGQGPRVISRWKRTG
jgi:predicted PurR-regulated permease PerM